MRHNIDLTALESLFAYHKPTVSQASRYADIRAAGKFLAQVILERCQDSRERSTAITQVQQAVMWANASIACNEEKT